jgi:hypothetical protein
MKSANMYLNLDQMLQIQRRNYTPRLANDATDEQRAEFWRRYDRDMIAELESIQREIFLETLTRGPIAICPPDVRKSLIRSKEWQQS